MSRDVVQEIIDYPNEERHIEIKQDMKWGGNNKAKIAKHIFAMANLRDGGWIVIGKTEQPNKTFTKTGMSQENFDSYDPDHVKAYAYSHAEPPIIFEVHKKDESGLKIVVFEIQGFRDTPIICKKTEGNILQKGDMYVRSKGMPESVKVQNYTEMKEIIDIAIDNGLQNLFSRLRFVGINFQAVPEITDRSRYDQEAQDII